MFIALWREGRDNAFNSLNGQDGQTITGATMEECWQNAKAELRRPPQECGEGHQLFICSVEVVMDL